MKSFIAAALLVTGGIAQAQSFDYEKSVGSAELYSTLATDQVTVISGDRGGNFAYQETVGSHDLFPTLGTTDAAPQVSEGRTVFDYQRIVGSQELDPWLS